MGVTLHMQQEKALKILSQHRQSLADKYGLKKIGVFPYTDTANCDCTCGSCCGYHPQIGVAVEYKPEAKPDLLEFAGLKIHIEDLFGCDITLDTIGGHKDPRFKRDESYLEEVVYVR